MTFMTIPSTISGGPSIFQVRLSSGEVLTSGDEADVLMAFYQHSYDNHIDFVKEGGIVLYDTAHVEPREDLKEKFRHIGCPIAELTVEAIGGTAKDKGKNIFALGLVARMFDLDAGRIEGLIVERFKGKPESITTTALSAFHAGNAYPMTTLAEIYEFEDPKARDSEQVVCTGNEALGYGILAAGVRLEPVTRSPRGRTSWNCFDANCPNTTVFSSSAKTKSPRSPWPLAPVGAAVVRSPGPRPGHCAQGGSDRLGGDGGDSADCRRRPTRWPFHWHAHQRGTKRFEHRLLWRPWRLPARGLAPASVEDCFTPPLRR